MATSSSGVTSPETVRHLQTPAALALADLTSIFDDLTVVVGCCEQILSKLVEDSEETSHVVVEALWTTALISYRRCFHPGQRGVELTEVDLDATGLQGDLRAWHHMLEKLRAHYVDANVNPRDAFVVGVSQDAEGKPNGIAITSAGHARVDDTTARQTGQLALELSRIVDERIKEHQKDVYAATRSMSADDLIALAVIELADSDLADSSDG